MKQKTNILFVCKYNRFRSRVAKAYFKKINRNPKIKIESAGIIKGSFPLDKNQVRSARKIGLNINGSPKTLSSKLLSKTNIIVIVANDVPKEIFKYHRNYLQKIIIWKIADVSNRSAMKGSEKIIKQIIKKVDGLVKELK